MGMERCNGADWLALPRLVCTQHRREEGTQPSVAMAVSERLCVPASQAHCGVARSVM